MRKRDEPLGKDTPVANFAIRQLLHSLICLRDWHLLDERPHIMQTSNPEHLTEQCSSTGCTSTDPVEGAGEASQPQSKLEKASGVPLTLLELCIIPSGTS